jgi:putative phosphoesterase
MLLAFISDIHGNLPALESAFADAKKRGASRFFCAGDMTGYGPFPDEVCQFLQKHHIPAITGNYDQKVIAVIRHGSIVAQDMKEKKQRILLWTVEHLSRETQNYLSQLPESMESQLSSGQKILVVHGSPVSPDDALYPSVTSSGLAVKLGDARPDILVCGHTHIPFVKRVSRILVVNCGSAGHPVDGDPRPSYALVRAGRGLAPSGRIIRFDYDKNKTIAALETTSLPKGLRKDFAEGIKRRFLQ